MDNRELRLNKRLASIIKSAILHRSLNEKEMLEKGIEFLVFTISFHHEVKVKV